ncbi:MAG: ABC transporter permease [Trueperaceae bacterium]|nr:ABC transporter permease [Trueperaceae bacterium]
MAVQTLRNDPPEKKSEARSALQTAWRRFRRHRLAMVSSVVLLLIIVACFSAPLIAPHDPARVQGQLIFAPPDAEAGYYLGNDYLGRDILSRLLYGGQISLIVGFSVAFINAIVGVVLGSIAGYFSGQPVTVTRALWRPKQWHQIDRGTLIGLSLGAAAGVIAAWLFSSGGLRFGLLVGLWLLVSAGVWTRLRQQPRAALRWGAQAVAWPLLFVELFAFGQMFSDGFGETATLITWIVIGLAIVGLGYVAVLGTFRLDLDVVISRAIDFALSVPLFPILLVLAGLLNDPQIPLSGWVDSVFGEASSVVLIIIVLASLGWITNARLIRGEILKLRQQEYADAARAIGVRSGGVMFRHLLPNAVAPLIVAITLDIGTYIIIEAGLSFLGFGIQEPAASWGNMLNGVQNYVLSAPWLAIWPGLMIVITVLSFNYIGDGLRDALDPRSRL